jgi:hypothetical protein
MSDIDDLLRKLRELAISANRLMQSLLEQQLKSITLYDLFKLAQQRGRVPITQECFIESYKKSDKYAIYSNMPIAVEGGAVKFCWGAVKVPVVGQYSIEERNDKGLFVIYFT